MIEDKSQEISCSNCKTRVTPLWRRSNDGSYLCNACGLYYKIHKSNRPHELKTESFRHRQRTRRSTSPIEYCDRSLSSERDSVYDSEKRYRREEENLFEKENRDSVYDSEKRYRKEEENLLEKENRDSVYESEKRYSEKRHRKEEDTLFENENREIVYDSEKRHKREEERNFSDTNIYFLSTKKSDRFFDSNFRDSKDFTLKKNDTVKKQNKENLSDSPLINIAIQKSINPSLTLGIKKHISNEYKCQNSNYSDEHNTHTEYNKEYISAPCEISHTYLPLRNNTTANITNDSFQYDRGLKRRGIDVIDRFTEINKGESVKYMKGGSKDYVNCGDENTFYGDNEWNKKEWNSKFSRKDMKREEYIGELKRQDYLNDDWNRRELKREEYISEDFIRKDRKREQYCSEEFGRRELKRDDNQKDEVLRNELKRSNLKNNKFIGGVNRLEFEKSTACINDLYKRVNFDKENEYCDILNNEKSFSEEKEESEKYFDELEYLAASVLISFMKNR